MDDFLSTRRMRRVLGRSEALRLPRERIQAEAGCKQSDRALEKLIDVIATNEGRGS